MFLYFVIICFYCYNNCISYNSWGWKCSISTLSAGRYAIVSSEYNAKACATVSAFYLTVTLYVSMQSPKQEKDQQMRILPRMKCDDSSHRRLFVAAHEFYYSAKTRLVNVPESFEMIMLCPLNRLKIV